MPITISGPGTIGGGAEWKEVISIDWSAESNHNLKTEGTYVDANGISWDPTDGNHFDNVAGATVFKVENGTGLVITTSGSGIFGVRRLITDFIADFKVTDQLMWVVEFSGAAPANNWEQRYAWSLDVPDTGHLAGNFYSGGNEMRHKAGSNTKTYATGTDYTVHGIRTSGDTGHILYGNSWSDNPLDDLTSGALASLLSRTPVAPNSPFQASDANLGAVVRNSNSTPAYTCNIVKMKLWRLE